MTAFVLCVLPLLVFQVMGLAIIAVTPDGLNGEYGAKMTRYNLDSTPVAKSFPLQLNISKPGGVTLTVAESATTIVLVKGQSFGYLFFKRYCRGANYTVCDRFRADADKQYMIPFSFNRNFDFKLAGNPCYLFARSGDTFNGFVTDGTDIYGIYFDNNMQDTYISRIGYANGNCTKEPIVKVPANRMWQSPYCNGTHIFYVTNDQKLVTLSLQTRTYTELALPNDSLFSRGWAMNVFQDSRNLDRYLVNTNKDRWNSLWRISQSGQFTLLSKGQFGTINIAMALAGSRPKMDKQGLVWGDHYSTSFTPWDLAALDRAQKREFPQGTATILNGDWSLTYD